MLAALVEVAPGGLQLIDSITAKGAPLGDRRTRGADAQATGRSRGGCGTELQLVVDALSRVLAFVLTPGEKSDTP